MNVVETIGEFLRKHNIEFTQSEHEPTPTSELAAKVRGVSLETGAKAMVLRSKGKFVMCVLRASDKIDFSKMKMIMDTKSVSFASAEEVEKVTHCKPGGVPPFGNLFDLHVYCDKRMLRNEIMNFNAGVQTISMMMNVEEWKKVVKPEIVDLAL